MYHCCPSYFMAINLPWIKNKQQFLQNYQKTNDVLHWYLDIISWIIFNPLKLPTSQQLSFCADQCWSFTAVIHFKINFKTTFRSLLLCIRFCEIGCNIFFFKLCKILINEHKNSFFYFNLGHLFFRETKKSQRVHVYNKYAYNLQWRHLNFGLKRSL